MPPYVESWNTLQANSVKRLKIAAIFYKNIPLFIWFWFQIISDAFKHAL